MKTIEVKALVGDVVYAINADNNHPLSIHRVEIVNINIDKDNIYYNVRDCNPNKEEEEWGSAITEIYDGLSEAVTQFTYLLKQAK